MSEAFEVGNENRLNVGMFRVGVPATTVTFREAVNNVVARDYLRLGAVHVQMQEEHVASATPAALCRASG